MFNNFNCISLESSFFNDYVIYESDDIEQIDSIIKILDTLILSFNIELKNSRDNGYKIIKLLGLDNEIMNFIDRYYIAKDLHE